MDNLDEKNNKRIQILRKCLNKNIAFFAYSLPNTKEIIAGVQIKDEAKTYEDLSDLEGCEGFVFSPFDQKGPQKSYFIRNDIDFDDPITEDFELIDNFVEEESNIHESEREEYAQQIVCMLDKLKQKKLDKVILSRIYVLNKPGRSQAVSYFLKLNEAYPNAFVSMLNIPKVGLWIGASPERLIASKGNNLETVALAGTQKLGSSLVDDVVWESKEIEEQAYVSKYVDNLLESSKISDYKRIGPFTSRAGNIVHLKTRYQINAHLNFQQKSEFVQNLHPTPAICGLPKEKAMDLIRSIENHDREYYAGYLGPIKSGGNLSLFVNLRCMKVFENKMALYVGGGITAESNSEKEWEETCFKAQTLLNVIK